MTTRAPLVALVALLAFALLVACSDKPADADLRAGDTTPVASQTAATPSRTGTPPPAATSGAAPAGAPEFEGDRALAHIEALSVDIGPRVAGTTGEQQAIDYIAEQFRASGYDVEVMEFMYQGDRFRAGLVSTAGEEFEAYTMQGSAGEAASGPAVFVGLADAAAIGGKDLAGKVAVADRGTIPFSEKLANVQAAGAVALVVVNNEAGGFVGNVGEAANIPAVGIDQAAGDALRAAAASGAEVAVTAAGADNVSHNVIARTAAGAACDVLVGGHHDSVPAAPGALDNASGVATTLELARAFAADGLDDGLCFATFGAEESGLFGSEALVQRMQAEGTLPRTMVNLDMTGLGDSVDLIGSPELAQVADRVADELGIEAALKELDAFLGSDHQSFQAAGVAVIFLTTDDLGQFHTPGDTIATIDPADLEHSGDLAYALLTELLA